MIAKSLMVGDWVYCEGQPTPENVTIQTIAEDGVWFNGPNYEGAASYNRIFPIPLTPEILEKNGFEYMSNSNYDYEDGYGHLVRYDSFSKRLRILRDLDVAYDSGDFADVNVHQLQHALKLCCIDKEIVL